MKRDRIGKILLMSDAHWMVVPPEDQKGQIIKGIDRMVEGWLIRRWKKKNNQNFRLTLLEAKNHGPFDQLIFLGDLAECVWNERGMISSRDISEIATLKNFIRHQIEIPFGGDDHFLPGDHELGYRLPLSIDPEGGMSTNSIWNFKIMGPLFDAWRIGDFHFITISSSLFSQKTEHLACGERKEIESLIQKQKEFALDYLRGVSDGQRVLLFLHDPDAIEFIDTLPGANKISQIFCGHMHAEKTLNSYQWFGRLANSFWGRIFLRSVGLTFNRLQRANRVIAWAKGNLRRLKLFEKYNLRIVPAPSGMLGQGSGFLILELFDNGEFEIQKFTV